ncbi:MAG: MlaA family lipoprotein, partial [Nitrosomonas sp.]|nr:MlaA family lipoprotein [Nitrosomonas sp.]
MTRSCNHLGILIAIILMVLASGCSSVPKTSYEHDEADPHEEINRVSYNFTDSVDRILLEPVVDVYVDYVPSGAQRSI